MGPDLNSLVKRLQLVESKAELLLRSLATMQIKVSALQTITVELASKSDCRAEDVERILSGFSDRYPPELVASLREEVLRLLPA